MSELDRSLSEFKLRCLLEIVNDIDEEGMNNLIRTLTESNVKPNTDLRLLLTTVKEGRKQSADTKLSDAFYDALEGLLLDLKTITLDNRDAEAFLKPVSKTEVPDYYDVIANPMDFQTMLKKVKGKLYKSKREFKDDLELIWSNCYTYNASENHPLRQCVKRLKAKADRLLKYVTDRRERADPIIPSQLGANHTGLYPKINGAGRAHTRSPSYIPKSTPGITSLRSASSFSNALRQSASRFDLSFPETPAITRTPEGMAIFYALNKEVDGSLRNANPEALKKLKELVSPSIVEGEEVENSDNDDHSTEVVGEKRKLHTAMDCRPKKRARLLTLYPVPMALDCNEISELWWAAAQSDTLLANSIPAIPFGPASSEQRASLSRHKALLDARPKPKRRKLASTNVMEEEILPTHIENPMALLNVMNTNIKTMRRIRHTHAKFTALNAATMANEDAEDGTAPVAGTSTNTGTGIVYAAGPSSAGTIHGSTTSGSEETADIATLGLNIAADDEILNEKVDERPWTMVTPARGKGKGKGKEKQRMVRAGGIEIGERNAWRCLQWANQKVLEHVGFQGTSQAALDVLVGVMSEYLSNVGRTIKLMSDKYSSTLTPEEIILHTLFESGISKVQDLERYIRDDVERYGSRLNELEKKIVGAYRESTAGDVLEDEGLFEDEEEDETGALAVGEFADLLGEDYLGLRELGIAAEFGMSSLTIPRKLLKNKKYLHKPVAVKSNEPPPPYPPPPSFIPLASDKVSDQIGLLKPYYTHRFTGLAAIDIPPPPPPLAPLPGPSLPGLTPAAPPKPHIGPTLSGVPPLAGPLLPGAMTSTPPLSSTQSIAVPGPQLQAQPPSSQQQTHVIDLADLPVLTLPDDVPSAVQMKMGPLGQITKGGGSSTTAKKKAKPSGAGANAVGVAAGGGETGDTITDAASPKKKKAVGISTGSGRKKKGPEGAPPSEVGAGQQASKSPYPPVIVASA